MLAEMMEELEINWPVEENAAVDAEEEEIHVVAALERADNEAAEASAHQGPAAAYVAGVLAAAAAADPAAAAADVADVAGDPADVAATEDAPQVYGALKCYSSHKRWWFHDMATNERALTIYGLAGLKGQCHNHKSCQCWLSEMSVSGEVAARVGPPFLESFGCVGRGGPASEP